MIAVIYGEGRMCCCAQPAVWITFGRVVRLTGAWCSGMDVQVGGVFTGSHPPMRPAPRSARMSQGEGRGAVEGVAVWGGMGDNGGGSWQLAAGR
jgi:hypothetical protein